MTYKEIEQWAKDHIANRDSGKHVLDKTSTILVDDASYFCITNSYIIEKEGWIVLFANRPEYIIFEYDEVLMHYQSDLIDCETE